MRLNSEIFAKRDCTEDDASPCCRDAMDIGRDTFIEKEPTDFNGHAISVM